MTSLFPLKLEESSLTISLVRQSHYSKLPLLALLNCTCKGTVINIQVTRAYMDLSLVSSNDNFLFLHQPRQDLRGSGLSWPLKQ